MLWVIVSHGFLMTHNDPHKLNAESLWVMWVIVAALFNRSQYGALHQSYKYIQILVIEKHYPQ